MESQDLDIGMNLSKEFLFYGHQRKFHLLLKDRNKQRGVCMYLYFFKEWMDSKLFPYLVDLYQGQGRLNSHLLLVSFQQQNEQYKNSLTDPNPQFELSFRFREVRVLVFGWLSQLRILLQGSGRVVYLLVLRWGIVIK